MLKINSLSRSGGGSSMGEAVPSLTACLTQKKTQDITKWWLDLVSRREFSGKNHGLQAFPARDFGDSVIWGPLHRKLATSRKWGLSAGLEGWVSIPRQSLCPRRALSAEARGEVLGAHVRFAKGTQGLWSSAFLSVKGITYEGVSSQCLHVGIRSQKCKQTWKDERLVSYLGDPKISFQPPSRLAGALRTSISNTWDYASPQSYITIIALAKLFSIWWM